MSFPGAYAMNKLPKEKRNQFIVVVLITVVVLSGIFFGLIRMQHDSLSKIKQDTSDAKTKLQKYQNTINSSDAVQSQLIDVSYNLNSAEDDMASGDIYAWTIDLIRRFKTSYKVEIPQIGQPEMSDVDILPNFPYKQVKFTVNGTAYYHDFGKFVMDFENAFPHIRLVNLSLEPVSGGGEKLSFKVDMIALVKPNPTMPK
jgi:Tfp pilus assembly protein PilO